MPVLIDEVIAEISENSPPSGAAAGPPMPLPAAELELQQTLALLQERRLRLALD